jgi:ubiquitin carboxyl-terminal hydrolase L3
MIPRPVKAVVLVFPYGEARDRRRAEDERIAKEGGPNVDETVFWAKQTVRDLSSFLLWEIDDDGRLQVPGACGTMALIHGLANVRFYGFLLL